MLELGSGTGLVGLSAAVAVGADVLMTDVAVVLPLLQHNVEANQQLVAASGGRAAAAALLWEEVATNAAPAAEGTGAAAVQEGGLDQAPIAGRAGGADAAAWRRPWAWVLGADLVYREQQVAPLVGALVTLCSCTPAACRVLLAHKHRHIEVDRLLWSSLEALGFRRREVHACGQAIAGLRCCFPSLATLSLSVLECTAEDSTCPAPAELKFK